VASPNDTRSLLLRLRQGADQSHHRPAQLVQPGKRHLELGFDASDLNQPAARRLTRAIAHQGGLADARLTADDQDCALTLADTVQHAVQLGPFA